MQEIVSSEREDYGLNLTWRERGAKKGDFFTYSELVDMKINVLDLIEHPHFYRIDGKRRKILATPKGCCQCAEIPG